MNHNYYYTLLGSRAGGPGTVSPVSDCTGTFQLRYSVDIGNGRLSGATGSGLGDWTGLVFGSIVPVWPSTPAVQMGTKFYLNQAQTLEVDLVQGNWFRIEAQLFQYVAGTGITSLVQISQPSPIQIKLNSPQPVSCQLGGPYPENVWVNRSEWQQVDRVWLDQALSQPYVGGLNWYAADGTTIADGGTTLQINNCGWVTNFFAC